MAKIAFCWELGSGMGHIAPYRVLFNELTRRGHELHLICRQLDLLSRLMNDIPHVAWQAPFKAVPPRERVRPTRSMPELLLNVGYDDARELTTRVKAWGQLIKTIRPDLTLVDYAPTALLALRGIEIPYIQMGLGFYYPPSSVPVAPYLLFSEQADSDDLRSIELTVTDTINDALATSGSLPINSFHDLFDQAQVTVIHSPPQLDHYGQREEVSYVGIAPWHSGGEVTYGEGRGPKVFAYLKPFKGIGDLLKLLSQLRLRTILKCDRLPNRMKSGFTSQTLRFVDQPLNVSTAFKRCDVAITNANGTTTAEALYAGRPSLMIPLQLEQEIISKRVELLGAGIAVTHRSMATLSDRLAQLLNRSIFTSSATAFAHKHPLPTPEEYLQKMSKHIQQLN